jgi:hypothetical protein
MGQISWMKKFKKSKDNMGRTLGCKTCVEKEKEEQNQSSFHRKAGGKARKKSGKSGRE